MEKSLKLALEKQPFEVNEFCVVPQVTPKKGLPFHEWWIEFKKPPIDGGDSKRISNKDCLCSVFGILFIFLWILVDQLYAQQRHVKQSSTVQETTDRWRKTQTEVLI